jgi:hypothetical protein
MQRYLHWPIWVSAIALLAFLLSTLALERMAPATFLADGAMYLPTVAACLAIVLAPIDADRQVRRIIALAVAQSWSGTRCGHWMGRCAQRCPSGCTTSGISRTLS